MKRYLSRSLMAALALGLLLPLGFLAACANSTPLRGKIAGLEQILEKAEKKGAMRCAPRELAIARSHIKFAEIELEQGFVSKASYHLDVAMPNARAADALSILEKCTDQPPPPPPKAPPPKPKKKPKPKPGDRDGDGYLDPDDKCPDDPENYNGFEDQDGCPDDPDTDGDGVKDSVDQCDLEPEDTDSYLDEDGCPEPDNDLDGIADTSDKCPLEPEDPDGYEDTDGCPEPDNDKDTVLDKDDQCPNTPGDADAAKPGCPKKPALAVITDCEVKITQKILFAYAKAAIRRQSYPILDAVKTILDANPDIKLEVQGHTDSRGSDSYNKRLSQKRAESVVRYLVQKGVGPNRLVAKGYGEEQPLVPNTTAANMSLNRRVQFIRKEGNKAGCKKPAGQ